MDLEDLEPELMISQSYSEIPVKSLNIHLIRGSPTPHVVLQMGCTGRNWATQLEVSAG